MGWRFWLGVVVIADALAYAFKLIKWLVGLGGDVDFILSRLKEPGWVGDMLGFLVEPPGWFVFVLVAIGLFLMAWDLRRHRRKIETASPVKQIETADPNRLLADSIAKLVDPNLVVRMSAIDDLLEVANKSKDLNRRVINAICNRIRDISPAAKEDNREVEIFTLGPKKYTANIRTSFNGPDWHHFAQYELSKKTPAPREVQELVSALARRNATYDDPQDPIDLSNVNLSGTQFHSGNFKNAVFVASTMRRCIFSGCDVSGANFSAAILNNSFFTTATAVGAIFSHCLGHRIHFDQANLTDANFSFADLYDVSIQQIVAHGANFSGACLWRAAGGQADLKGAWFAMSNLTAADFSHAKNLELSQIDAQRGTIIDNNTKLPWPIDLAEYTAKAGFFGAIPNPLLPIASPSRQSPQDTEQRRPQ